MTQINSLPINLDLDDPIELFKIWMRGTKNRTNDPSRGSISHI